MCVPSATIMGSDLIVLKWLNERRYSVWHIIGGATVAEVWQHAGWVPALICLVVVGVIGGIMRTVAGE